MSTARALFEGWLERRPVAYARARAVFSRRRLPPGALEPLDQLERRDRDFLRQRAERLGPVSKGIAWGRPCICVVGLDRCRRLTRRHSRDMTVETMELDALIPRGFLCGMEGSGHRGYSRALRQVLGSIRLADEEPVLERIATNGLRGFAALPADVNDPAGACSQALSGIATATLAWLVFGAEPGSPAQREILEHFAELGPYGLVWNPRERQKKAFRAFRDTLEAEVEAHRAGAGRLSPRGMLLRAAEAGVLDETLLGNLIYQAEMGRSDVANFFRWITSHVADEPEILERIAAGENRPGAGRPLDEAFVLEVLRRDQSERVMRRAARDFVFEGFLIPRFASIRLCLWESHHDEGVFPGAHCFDPARFLDDSPGSDRFAPFGVDHHQCPYGSVTMSLGRSFLRALARGFALTPRVPAPPVRGPYHWEPGAELAVELQTLSCPRHVPPSP